jgi:beta-lactamase regulating signal transducer with metallopeptidase domain
MNGLTAWLLMLPLHASVLLLAAWAIDAGTPSLRNASRELLWRTALFGCLLTATVQAFAPPSVIGRWHWTASTISVAPDADPGDALAAVPITPLAPAPFARIPQARTVIQTAVARDSRNLDLPATRRAVHWMLLLGGLWLLGALITLARSSGSLLRLRRELAQAAPVTCADALDDLAELAARAGVEPPRLLCLPALPSPIAVTGARIVLPAWSLQTLDRAQLQAMLAHELGHVVRDDPKWKLLSAGWCALLWFVPPAGIARRRLDDIAELACDAFAASHTGNGRSLAECLATCAERCVHGDLASADAFELAPAMAARQSSLLQRIERLLEGVPMDTTGSRALPRTVAASVLAAAVFCLPAIGFDPARANAAAKDAPEAEPAASAQPAARAKPAGASHSSVSISSDDGGNDTLTVSLSDEGHRFAAKVQGKIAFNDDDTDITGIGGAGTATLEETIGGVTRRLELDERAGKLERRYFVDRSERPLDDQGRQWITSVVLQLVRSGIGAEARAKRLYAAGGAPRVLDEIGQIPTDYVRGIYLRELVRLGKLTPAEVDRAVKLAGDMHSDYERRQALTAVFDTQALGAAEQVTFLRQALRFDSDYERAELLIGTLPKLAGTAEVRQAWLEAGLQVNSDYERRRTLQSMLTRGGLDATQLAAVIEASSSMKSDYEHRELLVAAAQHLHDPDAIALPYARSTQKITSDYERREALMALLGSGRIGAAGAGAVLDSAAQISSSYECREVLVALARVMPDDAALHTRYREVAQRLPDQDRGEAERALVR